MTGSIFLPPNQSATFERVDQGVDFKTRPGGVIVAPYPGIVSVARPNPGGFGTHYPLITFTAGPLKGQTWYIGHTLTLRTGPVKAGDPISRTGTGSESWMGNAKGIPGHAEIGRLGAGGAYPSMSAGASVKGIVLGGAGTAGSGQLTGLTGTLGKGAAQLGLGSALGQTSAAADLVGGLLDPLKKEGFRVLLYAALVFGGLAVVVTGAVHAARARPPRRESLVPERSSLATA